MVKQHLKRINAPKTWALKRKKTTFVTRPHPSGHSLRYCLPLTHVLKDMLKYAKTTREVKLILHNKTVTINSRRVTGSRRALGFMDILGIEDLKEYYRLLINGQGKLELVKITAKEAALKLNKIIGKTVIAKGKIQLHLHDGSNIISDESCKVSDSVVSDPKTAKVSSVLSFDKGNMVYIIEGKHVGKYGPITALEGKEVSCTVDGTTVETKKDKCIIIGKDKATITLYNGKQ